MVTVVGETERDASLAQGILRDLDGPDGFLSVGRRDTNAEAPAPATQQLPREIGTLLQQVLEAVASGSTVTITATPREVTTSTAAAMLGVSRPTLMKMISTGSLPSHKVGSHTRLLTADVQKARAARRARERAAFAELLELEGDSE